MAREHGAVVAVIPALNEAGSIGTVVGGLLTRAAVIVVDDGSTDETSSIARKAGARVVRHELNRGYDAALATGLADASAQGYELVITMDADGQHNPDLIEPFIMALRRGADLVVGVRDYHQRFSESLFAWIGKRFWGISDPLCGMKGYRLERFASAGQFDRYPSVGTSFAIYAARNGLAISEIAVRTRPRVGTARFGRGLRANYIILKALMLGLLNL